MPVLRPMITLASMFPQRTDVALHTQLERVVGNPPAALRCLLLGGTARFTPALAKAVSLCKHCLRDIAAFEIRFASLEAELLTGMLTVVRCSGKTSLLLQYAFTAATAGSAVLYICKRSSSLEDAAEGVQCWQLPEHLLQNIGVK